MRYRKELLHQKEIGQGKSFTMVVNGLTSSVFRSSIGTKVVRVVVSVILCFKTNKMVTL